MNSIKNIIRKAGYDSVLTADPDIVIKASKIILPGVGSYDNGMSKLQQAELIQSLNQRILSDKIPVLGVCLGVQLFCSESQEGTMKGLNWINARVVRFDIEKLGNLKVPHMGWTDVQVQKDSLLFRDMYENPRFYFVHSFHLQCNDEEDILTSSTYGYNFVSAVEKENIIGVQFHPEKSHKFGLRLYENFIKNY